MLPAVTDRYFGNNNRRNRSRPELNVNGDGMELEKSWKKLEKVGLTRD